MILGLAGYLRNSVLLLLNAPSRFGAHGTPQKPAKTANPFKESFREPLSSLAQKG